LNGDTRVVAEFISGARYEDLPDQAVDLAKQALLDSLGVAIAGVASDEGRIALRYVEQQRSGPAATLFGTRLKAAEPIAAFGNGVLIHALDYDDGNHPAYAHPSCVLWSSVFALGEPRGISGRDALLAYLVGFDVLARIGGVLSPTHGRRGWHATATLGTMGAAAASAKVLGLDPLKVRHTLGVAGSSASGLKQNLGTMTKPYHAGHSAWSGVTAAQLADAGWEADADILEGQAGFYQLFQGADKPKPEYLLAGLGTRWEITGLPAGWYPKAYASCGGTHNTIDAIRALRRNHAFTPEDVVEIGIGVNTASRATLFRHDPQTGQEGKYSLEFCAAVALIDGAAGPAQFTAERVRDPRIRRLYPLARISSPPEIADDPEYASIITLTLKDGRVLTQRQDLARGKPANPMTREDQLEKFRACTAGVLQRAGQDRLIGLIDELERATDVRPLLDATQPSAGRAG
jgi:2-methylcitrate dehydratase PrpD